MPRTIVYRRVSTDEQAESGAGLDAQLDACRAWAERHGLDVAGPHDDDLSGATPLLRRPGLLAALDQVQAGDVLLVAKRDRLGRDPMVVGAIELEVVRQGGRVVSVAGEGTNDDSPASVLMRRIIDAFAEYERLIIRARTKSALDGRRSRGRRIGTVPYGSALAADGTTLLPAPAELAAIDRMVHLRRAGASYRQIGLLLTSEGCLPRGGGSWSPATISRLVTRSSHEQ